RFTGRALSLVWSTSRRLTVAFAVLSLFAGLLPAAIAYVGKWIVDAVVLATADGATQTPALRYVACELGLVAALGLAQRGLSVCEALLRALLGQRVNELILEKALTLQLRDFEDSEFHDRMTR